MYYYLDICKIDGYGRIIPYTGQYKFTSLEKARAKLIHLIDIKPNLNNLAFSNRIYENPKSIKGTSPTNKLGVTGDNRTVLRGTISKFGDRYQWIDYKDNSDYAHKEVYKNGAIKSVWQWRK